MAQYKHILIVSLSAILTACTSSSNETPVALLALNSRGPQTTDDQPEENVLCGYSSDESPTVPNVLRTYTVTAPSGYLRIQAADRDVQGNFYIAGVGKNLVSSNGAMDMWVRKIDINLEQVWEFKQSISADTTVRSLVVDSSGNVYVGGNASKIVSTNSRSDWWIKKIGSDGVEITTNWNKKLDHSGWIDGLNQLRINSDGHIFAIGAAGKAPVQEGVTLAGAAWWIKKFDASGAEDTANWNKTFAWSFNVEWPPTSGSYSDTYGNGAAGAATFDSFNNVYIGGHKPDGPFSSPYLASLMKFSGGGMEASGESDITLTDYSGDSWVGETVVRSLQSPENDIYYVVDSEELLSTSTRGIALYKRKADGSAVFAMTERFDPTDSRSFTPVDAQLIGGEIVVLGSSRNCITHASVEDIRIRSFSISTGASNPASINLALDLGGAENRPVAFFPIDDGKMIIVGSTGSTTGWILEVEY